MLYCDAEAMIRDLVIVNRRLVAAFRWLIDPTNPRQMRGTEGNLAAALAVIEGIEARLESGTGAAEMARAFGRAEFVRDKPDDEAEAIVPTDAGPDHYAGIFAAKE